MLSCSWLALLAGAGPTVQIRQRRRCFISRARVRNTLAGIIAYRRYESPKEVGRRPAEVRLGPIGARSAPRLPHQRGPARTLSRQVRQKETFVSRRYGTGDVSPRGGLDGRLQGRAWPALRALPRWMSGRTADDCTSQGARSPGFLIGFGPTPGFCGAGLDLSRSLCRAKPRLRAIDLAMPEGSWISDFVCRGERRRFRQGPYSSLCRGGGGASLIRGGRSARGNVSLCTCARAEPRVSGRRMRS